VQDLQSIVARPTVNDDELEDNRGAFQVTIRVEPALPPAVAWPEAPSDRLSPPPAVGGLIGKPVPDARVLLIYVDGLRMGGPEALDNLQPNDVQELRFISAADATTLYGTDHAGGIIQVTTRRR